MDNSTYIQEKWSPYTIKDLKVWVHVIGLILTRLMHNLSSFLCSNETQSLITISYPKVCDNILYLKIVKILFEQHIS